MQERAERARRRRAREVRSNASPLRRLEPGAWKDIARAVRRDLVEDNIGLVAAGVAAALWAASNGMNGLLRGVGIAYGRRHRPFLKQRLLALVFTLFAVAIFIVFLLALVVVPVVVSWLGLGGVTGVIIRFGRWPLLVALVLFGLATPSRPGPRRGVGGRAGHPARLGGDQRSASLPYQRNQSKFVTSILGRPS